MLIKVTLVVAIFVGLLTFGIAHFKVAEDIQAQSKDLEDTKTSLTQSREAEKKAKEEANTTKEQKKKTDEQLETTKAKLETETTRANTQEGRANRNETDLNKARGDLTQAARDLAAWKALGTSVDQVQNKLAELAETKQANEALSEEKKVMVRQNAFLQNELNKYQPEKAEQRTPLPPGLKGKVIAVDPKWDFVVLDIGSNQGVLERGELLVNREGKLVAKVRVTSVEASRCVANVIPEWKQAEIMEGDQVLP
jgi:myosin heavy subunit